MEAVDGYARWFLQKLPEGPLHLGTTLSREWRLAVLRSDLKPNGKLVALAVESYIQDNNEQVAGWPEPVQIAWITGLSESLAARYMQELSQRGWFS